MAKNSFTIPVIDQGIANLAITTSLGHVLFIDNEKAYIGCSTQEELDKLPAELKNKVWTGKCRVLDICQAYNKYFPKQKVFRG